MIKERGRHAKVVTPGGKKRSRHTKVATPRRTKRRADMQREHNPKRIKKEEQTC
jgi:hypothetical protein